MNLSEMQLMWLRGLSTIDRHIPMSATEMGNPEVSELQLLNLVHIRWTDSWREWKITPEGRAILTQH